MKNSYIVGLIIVLVVAGGVFFGMKKEKLEAPMDTDNGIAETLETGKVQEGDTDVSVSEEESSPLPVSVTTDSVVASGSVKEFTVVGKNFSFSPSVIKVKKGEKVKITFQNSEGFHDWKIDAYGVATKQSKAPTNEVLEFTADKAGSFEYYCSVGSHKAMGMKGVLTVE